MASNDLEQKIYSVGECPVCGDSGTVIALKGVHSGTMVYLCPLCGVAWRKPPLDGRIDEIASLRDLERGGVVLPTEEEALRTGYPSKAVSSQHWLPLLEDALVDPNAM
jgi:predicted RNA-binding Zn-ribbon protein involved in translation (DUF1610 family)